VVGEKGVDKRLDVLATAIKFGGKVSDLTELELAYAPPYSSAKDPVNIAGYVASNILSQDVEVYQWYDLSHRERRNSILLDVRQRVERQAGSIADSWHIPLPELRERISELPKDKEIIIYCQIGLRAYIAARILRQNGFKVKNLSGGYRTWRVVAEEQNLPLT
jgi:rhodanese-related sulfurtransferase